MKTKTLKNQPYFFLIGAMKAGTTHLYRMIADHPSVHRCRHKEPNFFVDAKNNKGYGNWHSGLDWYDSLFMPGEGLRGEASTRYSRFPDYVGVVDKMYRVLEDPRFLYLVRNPVDRAISQFIYSMLKGIEQKPIQAALAPTSTSAYVTAGLYHLQLSIFMTRFRRNQFHIIVSDELWCNPENTLNDIFQFLQLSPHLSNLSNASPINSMANVVHRLKTGDFQIVTEQQREFLKMWDDLPEKDRKSSSKIARHLGYDDAQRREFSTCFTEDLAALEQFIGRKLPSWS